MKWIAQAACFLAWLAVLALPAGATIHRDPLTEVETDQLREAAQDPPLKLKLFIKFARQRLESAEALYADPKADPDRGQQIHDLLEDFGNLVDELSDNVDAYATRKEDLRKPLADIIAATSDFAARLKDSKAAAAASSAGAKESKAYNFALEDAIDSVESGLRNAQELLEEQKEQFKKKK
jgi:HPt (histidine-containing phosphotransfer) domain-containing protein